MGTACQSCMRIFEKQPQQDYKLKRKTFEGAESDRTLNKQVQKHENDIRESSFIDKKGSNLEVQSNSSVKETKIFMKSRSTALFLNDSERRHSSIIQFTLDSESMIIKNPNQGQLGAFNNNDYYTLIDQIAFVKKTMDCIKITTPEGQSELNCPPQYLFSTLYVSEGIPVENIKEISQNKVIQTKSSPIHIKLMLICLDCKKKVKLTFCRGVIKINELECPKCEKKGNWKLKDVESNAPLWGNGVKIENHEELDQAPSVLRAMGCIHCLKFCNCETMKCGCLICKTCLAANEDASLGMCRMCQGSYIL